MVSNQIVSFNRSILGNVEIRKEKEFERMKEKSKKKNGRRLEKRKNRKGNNFQCLKKNYQNKID